MAYSGRLSKKHILHGRPSSVACNESTWQHNQIALKTHHRLQCSIEYFTSAVGRLPTGKEEGERGTEEGERGGQTSNVPLTSRSSVCMTCSDDVARRHGTRRLPSILAAAQSETPRIESSQWMGERSRFEGMKKTTHVISFASGKGCSFQKTHLR